MMKITKLSDTPIKENPHKVDVRMIYNNESAQAVHMQLNPGESLRPHITPVDVFFFVIEGTPDVLIGEEKKRVFPQEHLWGKELTYEEERKRGGKKLRRKTASPARYTLSSKIDSSEDIFEKF